MMKIVCILLFFVVCCFDDASSKTVSGRGYFGTRSIKEVTKFSFRPGKARVEGTIDFFGREPRGSLYLFMDTNWKEKFYNEEDCDKVKHATSRIPIGRVGRIGQGMGIADGMEPVYDDELNKSSWKFTWTITHAVRTYGWYFVIADCKGFENGDDMDGTDQPGKRRYKRNKFEYFLKLYNPGDDHLPADEHGLTTIYIIVTSIMAYLYWYSRRDFKKKNGHGLVFGSHPAIKAFAFAYLFQVVSSLFEIIHLWAYSSNGYGLFIFDFFSESLEALSQLIISFALLCLANGWTMINFPPKSGFLKEIFNKPKLDDETPTLFILIMIVFVSTILQIINKVQGDDFQKFHDHDGVAGKFLLFQRTAYAIMFVLSVRGTLKSKEVQGQMQTEGFLTRLMIFGSIWFFAFPVLVVLSNIFAHYLRHRIVTIGVLVIQSSCLTLMASQFLSSSSWFSKVSQVSKSGMLPGGFGASPKGGKLF